ncbi:hypothetical protein Tco_0904500 [Tanacetum coccineum]
MKSSSDSDQELSANMVFMAKMEKILSDSEENSSSAEETIAEDEYLKIISEKHVENEENTDIDENGSKSPPDEFEVWKGVATSNRGHVLGVGLTIDLAFVLIDEREAVEAHRVLDLLDLHKTLNDRLESFAKNYPPRATESDPGPS